MEVVINIKLSKLSNIDEVISKVKETKEKYFNEIKTLKVNILLGDRK